MKPVPREYTCVDCGTVRARLTLGRLPDRCPACRRKLNHESGDAWLAQHGMVPPPLAIAPRSWWRKIRDWFDG